MRATAVTGAASIAGATFKSRRLIHTNTSPPPRVPQLRIACTRRDSQTGRNLCIVPPFPAFNDASVVYARLK